MSAFLDPDVSTVWFPTPAPGRVLGTMLRRWRRLTTLLSDRYRPEQHYMRGPGPKWREKHSAATALELPWRARFVKPQ
jgi:hypothetical protein